MDVSATGPTVAAAVPQASVDTITGTVASSTPQEASSTSHVSPQPAPASSTNGNTIAPAIAKLFGGGGSPAPEPVVLDVSYRVLHDPNQIVTVFSDPKTGQEIAQFPPDILINLAQFFGHQQGVTLDRNA